MQFFELPCVPFGYWDSMGFVSISFGILDKRTNPVRYWPKWYSNEEIDRVG